MARQRADRALVERKLFESRAKAQEAIAAGGVRADGRLVRKASELIDAGASIEAAPPYPWVSPRRSTLSASIRRGLSVSISAPRPAASPTFSLPAAPRRSSPSTSDADNCTLTSPAIRASRPVRRPTRAVSSRTICRSRRSSSHAT
jgi:hypothetical protein